MILIESNDKYSDEALRGWMKYHGFMFFKVHGWSLVFSSKWEKIANYCLPRGHQIFSVKPVTFDNLSEVSQKVL